MNCSEPFVKAGEVYPCGKCLPCKFRSRRIWFHRVLLEASQHDYSSVVTLTYDDAALPVDGELQPDHLRNWLKRYRKRALERYPWRVLRFVASGEYGENFGRPHYHVVLFGVPGCSFGRGGRLWCSDCGCDQCQDISSCWSVGESSVDTLSKASAAYVAGYVTRKVVASSCGKKLAPFMRMSNRPGIGADAMDDVASTVLKYNLSVPASLQHGGKAMPLGRYLRKRLAERSDAEVPRFEATAAMRSVRDYAWHGSRGLQSVYTELNGSYASQLQQKEALRRKVL